MEPWDGPAAMAFTDGRQIGATLDRNGLRPARYLVTDDDMVIMASEMGVLPIPEEKIVTKWRLQPGKMLLIDLEQGRIISDEEIKAQLSGANPYKEWLAAPRSCSRICRRSSRAPRAPTCRCSIAAGLRLHAGRPQAILMAPMATTGQEAVGSMGTDTPISALSDKSKLLYTYFKQNFAQVTNPPIDPIREELVMSLVSFIGPRPNLFDLEGVAPQAPRGAPADPHQRGSREDPRIGHGGPFDTKTLDITYPVSAAPPAWRTR
jgi:glutamate synthase (NADPH/NADH) large chain